MTIRNTKERLIGKLKEAFGPDLCAVLDQPDVVEIMLNPDGRLFVETTGGAMLGAGRFDRSRAETLIGVVAHALGQEVHERKPIVSGEIPLGGHRFEGLLPPAVPAPTFSIRRRTTSGLRLCDYVENRVMSEEQLQRILEALQGRENIVVCGGTGSGKTTLANALMMEIQVLFPQDRIILIEDTVEIDCHAENAVCLRSSDEVAIEALLKSSLRLRPDRIMVGEVRDRAALTLLKAWNTGHPGGFTTLHANGARQALTRLEQLVSEASPMPMQPVIADAIDLVVAIHRRDGGRRVEEVVSVQSFENGDYRLA